MRAGTVKLLPLKRGEDKKIQPRVALQWCKTAGADALNLADFSDVSSTLWNHGKYVVSKSQDECKVGAWVFTQSPLSVSYLKKMFLPGKRTACSNSAHRPPQQNLQSPVASSKSCKQLAVRHPW